MTRINTFAAFILVSILSSSTVNSARILGLFVVPSKSHGMMTNALIVELANRGHEIVALTNSPLGKIHPNLTEINVLPAYDFWSDVKKVIDLPGIFAMNDMSFSDTLLMMNTVGLSTAEYALKHPNVQKLIDSTDQHFDLVIAEQYYQEAFLMFAHKFKAPVITLGTFGFGHYMNEIMGSFGAWSHVPHETVWYDDNMSFLQRVNNVGRCVYEKIQRTFSYYPQQQALIDQYFSQLPEPKPNVFELESRVSAIFVNSYAPLATSRPIVPGFIEVGGLHIKEPRPLPADIQEYLDGASDGVIFFSLGSNLKSSEMPEQQLQSFIRIFNEFSKFRVLWKWEDEDISKLPKNVMVKPWLPQSDILAHPNVKLFITHGGLMGTQEGVYRGVPMLGIPIFCDQHLNMQKANAAGFAIVLQFKNITDTSLRWALNELLYNPVYTAKMKRASHIFRDRPESPLEKAVYWVEYIIRHKGADHLKSAGVNLSWFSYFLLDIIGVFIILLVLLWMVAKRVADKLFDGNNNVKELQSQKMKQK